MKFIFIKSISKPESKITFSKSQSYTEQTSIHNGVFVNPQTRKPRPLKERAPQPPNERGGRGNSNKRGRDKEVETELRRQPSMRSHSNAYQQVMDQYSDLTTRSSFRVRMLWIYHLQLGCIFKCMRKNYQSKETFWRSPVKNIYWQRDITQKDSFCI